MRDRPNPEEQRAIRRHHYSTENEPSEAPSDDVDDDGQTFDSDEDPDEGFVDPAGEDDSATAPDKGTDEHFKLLMATTAGAARAWKRTQAHWESGTRRILQDFGFEKEYEKQPDIRDDHPFTKEQKRDDMLQGPAAARRNRGIAKLRWELEIDTISEEELKTSHGTLKEYWREKYKDKATPQRHKSTNVWYFYDEDDTSWSRYSNTIQAIEREKNPVKRQVIFEVVTRRQAEELDSEKSAGGFDSVGDWHALSLVFFPVAGVETGNAREHS